MAALRQSLSSALGASRRSSVASSSSSSILSFSTSASSAAAPRPLATRPRSQIDTEAPRNVHELTERYPNHPLLAFFHREEQEFTAPQTEDESGGKPQTIRKQLPVVLPLGQLKKDSGSRAWLAPELRTKSSLELHQLWYRCLMERNRFVTTRTELERTGAKRILTAWSAPYIDRRVSEAEHGAMRIFSAEGLSQSLMPRQCIACSWHRSVRPWRGSNLSSMSVASRFSRLKSVLLHAKPMQMPAWTREMSSMRTCTKMAPMLCATQRHTQREEMDGPPPLPSVGISCTVLLADGCTGQILDQKKLGLSRFRKQRRPPRGKRGKQGLEKTKCKDVSLAVPIPHGSKLTRVVVLSESRAASLSLTLPLVLQSEKKRRCKARERMCHHLAIDRSRQQRERARSMNVPCPCLREHEHAVCLPACGRAALPKHMSVPRPQPRSHRPQS